MNRIFLSVSSSTSLENKTGDWREKRPVFEEGLSPCQLSCPAGNEIPAWINLLRKGKFKLAWQELINHNPLPAITSRVCQHFCQKECNRKDFDQALNIPELERFLGDLALNLGWQPEKPSHCRTQKIAIVGSGPAGLSCGFYLSRKGYFCLIFEKEKIPGGMLALGIPDFRLSREILTREIERNILSLAPIKLEVEVGKDLDLEKLKTEFDFILIATGAHRSKKLNLKNEKVKGVISGLEFLKKYNLSEKIEILDPVLVVGGGNTALDCARVAKRMGKKVKILYRRREKDMPAIGEEIDQAKKEGIEILELLAPAEILAKERLKEVIFQKMALVEKDSTQRPRPVPLQQFERFPAKTLIVAIGEEPNLDFLKDKDPKILIAGDAREILGTVAGAIGQGKEAAAEIEAKIKNQSLEKKEGKIIRLEDLNLDYFSYQKREEKINLYRLAKKEAKRCFSCGHCLFCKNCKIFCPDLAIDFEEERPIFNYDYCKGCGICKIECQTGSISMIREV